MMIHGWEFGVFGSHLTGVGCLMSAQAASAVRDQEMILLTQQAAPSIDQAIAMTNYRAPVHVPQGWRDWFETGDQLH